MTLPDGSRQVARWNPCETITYQVSVRGIRTRREQNRAVRVTRATVNRFGSVSGLRFVFRGRSGVIPRKGGLGRQPVDLLIGFVRPGQTDYNLSGRIAGFGGWRGSYVWSRGAWRMEITKAYVVIDHPQTFRWPDRLSRRGVTRPNLLTHELGHAVGLGHVHDRREIMYPYLRSGSPAGFGVGDRRGLHRVGAAAGCI
ncbi:MAG: matrixin family metalloprotease [Marmoricola sp.]